MNKKKIFLFFFSIFLLFSNCSFDKKTGIWTGSENEKKRITELEKEQQRKIERVGLYSSEILHNEEIQSTKKIKLSEPEKNSSWQMSKMNYQNFLGNIYLPSIENNFLKKKIGKNKFSFSQAMSSPLFYNENIIFSDDTGTIYNINKRGKIKWKKNIYKKVYKKIYKILTFSIYDDAIYIADNIGFIYKINAANGEVVWIKNHGVPLKSSIKVFSENIFLVNQDNRIICLRTIDGSMLWNYRSVASFIKSQHFLSLAISKDKDLFVLNSSGELTKLKTENGKIYWTLSTLGSLYAHDTDFFASSDIVLNGDEIIFSTFKSTFSLNTKTGQLNWELNIGSKNTPIIDGNNVFLITNNGYFLNIDRSDGKIIWSTKILNILKKKKQATEISGFVLGSGKIYVVTRNGYLIICSATSGNAEGFKKIGNNIIANPIISNGALYILTEKSRIFGFN